MGKILLLEDDENLKRGISFKLDKEGYDVYVSSTVEKGLELFQENRIDLVICDITLEDGSGLDFCRKIRETSHVSFIFLTALDQEIDIVMGYEVGADDYITKPFSLSILISKVNAIFRRLGQWQKNQFIESGIVTLNKDEMKVFVKGEEVLLTKTEWKLLHKLMEYPLQILTKNQLLEALWDMDGDFVDENTLAVNIKRLRGKIEPNPSLPEYIKNIRGVGYIWNKECTR